MRILEHLRRQGHQALVVAPDEGPDEHDGVRVVRVPAVSIPGAAVPPVGLPTWRLQKVMAEFAPEVVHLASPIVLGAGGLTAARRMIVGHVGRLAPEKHVERLAALDDLPGVRVVVVGDGPERSHLQRGLPQAVFLGMLTGDELARAYASFDVFAPGPFETFGQLATFPSRDSERRQLAASCSSSGVIWPNRSPGARGSPMPCRMASR